MTRTQNQKMGDAHEAAIAEWIGGRRTKGSGNQWHNQMDAKNDERIPFPIAGDGKATLGKTFSVTREMWKKVREQTFGQLPAVFGRFYRDESLRTVDLDLVTMEVRDFLPILEAARKWKDQEDRLLKLGMGDPGPVSLGTSQTDAVAALLRKNNFVVVVEDQ